MNYTIAIIAANLLSIIFAIGAVAGMLYDTSYWGWFLAASLLTAAIPTKFNSG